MSVKISKTNSKLGIIPSVNLPPIITCRANAPCAKDCYAMKGRFRFSNVRDAMLSNYDQYKNDPERYFRDIKESINNGFISYSYFRWHAAGDIVDEAYFKGMVQLATELSQTSFLVFTKKYELVNSYIENGGKIPRNLHIVFSAWGSSLRFDNRHGFPVAYVRLKDEHHDCEIPESAAECSGNCTKCLQCWNMRCGESVVFNKH